MILTAPVSLPDMYVKLLIYRDIRDFIFFQANGSSRLNIHQERVLNYLCQDLQHLIHNSVGSVVVFLINLWMY